jgi:hypothetical protein
VSDLILKKIPAPTPILPRFVIVDVYAIDGVPPGLTAALVKLSTNTLLPGAYGFVGVGVDVGVPVLVGVNVFVGVFVGVSVLVGVIVGVNVFVGVIVGVNVFVGVGDGGGYDRITVFDIVGPPTEQYCVILKYTVPVVIVGYPKTLGEVQVPALLNQLIPSDEISRTIVPQDAALVKK